MAENIAENLIKQVGAQVGTRSQKEAEEMVFGESFVDKKDSRARATNMKIDVKKEHLYPEVLEVIEKATRAQEHIAFTNT